MIGIYYYYYYYYYYYPLENSTLSLFKQSILEAIDTIKEKNPEISFDNNFTDISINEASVTDSPNIELCPITSIPFTESRCGRRVKQTTPINMASVTPNEPLSDNRRTPFRHNRKKTSLNSSSSILQTDDLPLDDLLDCSNTCTPMSTRKRSKSSTVAKKKVKQDMDDDYSLEHLLEQTADTSNDFTNVSTSSSKKVHRSPSISGDKHLATDMDGSPKGSAHISINGGSLASCNSSTGSCEIVLRKIDSVLSDREDNSRDVSTPLTLSKDSDDEEDLPRCNFGNDSINRTLLTHVQCSGTCI